MKNSTTISMSTLLAARRTCAGLLAGVLALLSVGLSGCQCGPSAQTYSQNPALRPIQPPAGATSSDADRATLGRFVGIWKFEGWTAGTDGSRQPVAGNAAAAIESEHFVLLSIHSTTGQLAGRAGRTVGSMLLAAEPQVGITLTAWGDASPFVRRLTGQSHGNGSVFSFSEPKRGMSLTLTFETDDRWVAEARETDASGQAAAVATYTFTRATE